MSEDARAIAKEAYIYAFSMTENYKTIYEQAVDASASEYVGGFGKYRHYAQAFTAANRDIVTPNNDTPYSWAWLDLRAEPFVLTVPPDPEKRYYVTQWVDIFTFNFAYVGARATGFEGGDYLFVGPKWKGTVPPGIKQVFHAESDIVGTLTRTALNGPEDVPNVRAFQAKLKLQPLSAYLGQSAPPAAPPLTFPPYVKEKASTHDLIGYLNFLLQFAQPPHPSEVALMQRFAQIGIAPGKPFDAASVDPALLAAIDAGIADGKAALKDAEDHTFSSNGLFGSREALKNDYMTRAVAAAKGIYGNSLEEAWYGGFVGDGTKPSKLYFSKENLPPAKFFWSLTLYTLPDRLLFDNPLNRYSLGDRTKGLQYGDDGSLTIYLGHESPGKEKESNWLPAPAGLYSLVARVYGPELAALNGTWKLPALIPAA